MVMIILNTDSYNSPNDKRGVNERAEMWWHLRSTGHDASKM